MEIEMLRKIGLSDLEARCYLTLLEETDLSGYEVAKRVSVSRTNVYAALRSLTDKGACRVIEGEPLRYNAVPADQLIKLLQDGFTQTAKQLLAVLNTKPRKTPAFFNWQGNQQLETALQRVIAIAEHSLVVDIWAEDFHVVEGPLLEAERRGVKVTVVMIGQCPTPLKHIIEHKRNEEWTADLSRKFSVLCDSQTSIIGSFGGDIKAAAVETDHPAVSELLRNAFYHDAVMTRIEQDFPEQLRDKYGEHYQFILESVLESTGLKH